MATNTHAQALAVFIANANLRFVTSVYQRRPYQPAHPQAQAEGLLPRGPARALLAGGPDRRRGVGGGDKRRFHEEGGARSRYAGYRPHERQPGVENLRVTGRCRDRPAWPQPVQRGLPVHLGRTHQSQRSCRTKLAGSLPRHRSFHSAFASIGTMSRRRVCSITFMRTSSSIWGFIFTRPTRPNITTQNISCTSSISIRW